MLKKVLARLLAVAVLAANFTLLAGCNTMEGAGKDMQRGGEKIQDKANEHR